MTLIRSWNRGVHVAGGPAWPGRSPARIRPWPPGGAALLCALALWLPQPGGAEVPLTPAAGTGEPQAHARLLAPADTLVQVRLRDGTRLHGRVVAESPDSLTLETPGGTTVTLDRNGIEAIRTARGQVVDGRFVPEDPNRTRLLFSSTARPLRAGEGYVSSYLLFFPFVGVGLTDRVTLAGGTPILPGAMGEVFYLAPKVTVASSPGLDLAVGALGFFATRSLDEGSVGIVYGVGTFGEPDRAFTLGTGWGFSLGGGTSRIESDPVFVLGGEFRTGERTKFVTENWIVPGSGGVGLASGGVRFIGDRLTADLALGAAWDRGGGACCLPLVNFVYHFR